MTSRCSAAQVAEAVSIWSAHSGPTPILCLELEDTEELKCLDLILSTLDVFTDAFAKEMNFCSKEYNEYLITKKDFIERLKPRALLLTEKSGYFDFFLTCTYFSKIVRNLAMHNDCFHFDRVCCRLLTKIFEQRFQNIFEAPSGWENLLGYCINIHAAVYPSKTNLPPGYDSYNTCFPDDETFEDFDYERHLKDVEFSGVNLSYQTPENQLNSSRSKDVDACCGVSTIDDLTYWSYLDLDRETICEKLTVCTEHLENVYNLLKMLEQNLDTDCNLSDEYDVSISDDEYIEQLEKDESTLEHKRKIVFSEEMKKCLANENCSVRKEFFGDQELPVDVTDEETFEYIISNMSLDDDDDKCKLCDGKLRAFNKNWRESFHEKYPNSDIVTDVI